MPDTSKDVIIAIQHALSRKGFNPGIVDGVWGRNTENAVRRFQASAGLVVDGIVGPVTSAALLGEAIKVAPISNPATPWFQEAKRLTGLRETPGKASNPTIIDWAKNADIDYASDDIPWCGLFVAHCISSTLANEPLPGNPLSARSWLKFGAPSRPTLGSILIFWRGSKTGWQGHVGFYAGEDKAALHVLGGNQSDSVSITRIAHDRLLEARWPATTPFIDSGKIALKAGDTILSVNEA